MSLKEIPVPNTIVHNAPPPLVEVYGTHREMGCQIGEARREQVQHSIENAHLLIEQSYPTLELSWDGATNQSRKYLPFAEERYPQYVDEMRGIVDGANVTFDDVMVLNVMEAVTMDASSNPGNIFKSWVNSRTKTIEVNGERIVSPIIAAMAISAHKPASPYGIEWARNAPSAPPMMSSGASTPPDVP